MNTVGKILVICNLVFALITGGFLAVDFATRTNWRNEYDKLKDELTVSRENTSTLQATTRMVVDKLRKEEARAKGLEKTLDQERQKFKSDVELANVDALKQKGLTEKADITQMAQFGEAERLRAENKALLKVVGERDKAIIALQDDKNKALDQVTQAINDMQQYAERATSLAERVQELERWKAKAQVAAASGSAPTAALTIRDANQPNPPPAYVRGKIEKVMPDDKTLVQINLGTDAGVANNITLDVYRLTPEPKYLGTLRVVNAFAHSAIGRVLPSRAGGPRLEVRAGDEVASSPLPPR